MGWIEDLNGSIVGLDTVPLIYFIERHPKYLALVRPFFQATQEGEFQVVTSALTEVLVHPYRRGDRALAGRYFRLLLDAPNLAMLSVSPEIANEAARIRAFHGVKIPDSIQIAAALVGKATAFLTNDDGLPPIPGLRLIVLDKLLAELQP